MNRPPSGRRRGERVERRLVRALVEQLRPGLLLRPAHGDRARAARSARPSSPGRCRSPTRIASVGQTTTHAGSSPTSIRCAQKLHFSAEWSSGLMKIASYGQAAMHALQPMQIGLSKSTMPSGRRYIAAVGQAVTHGASVALVAARHLERAPRLRERPDLDVLDVRAGDAERHLVLRLLQPWCRRGSRCSGSGRSPSPTGRGVPPPAPYEEI